MYVAFMNASNVCFVYDDCHVHSSIQLQPYISNNKLVVRIVIVGKMMAFMHPHRMFGRVWMC